MTEFKIDELPDYLLDFAVGVVEGANPLVPLLKTGHKTVVAWDNDRGHFRGYHPSSDPRVGLPIADREHIDSGYCGEDAYPDWVGMWYAELGEGSRKSSRPGQNYHSVGKTRLEAMMRCRLKIASPNQRTIMLDVEDL